ncbi:MAG TPA: HAD family phosphatase [Anaerolineae bacterium]|nr:HAD family phosphatase [Anaerolineae bacterium]
MRERKELEGTEGTQGGRGAVIFDMDGVMVDTAEQHYAAWQRVFAEVGREFSEAEFRATFGMRNPEILRRFLGDDLSEERIEELGRRKEVYYRDLVREQVRPAPGLLSLLRELRAHGFKIAVGTSAPRENIELVLEALEISEEMDAVVGGADVVQGKPAPDTFLLAARRCGVPPERCLVIEDAPAGLAAARAAGMRSIGITGTKPRQALSEADLVVDSLTEVGVEVVERLLNLKG